MLLIKLYSYSTSYKEVKIIAEVFEQHMLEDINGVCVMIIGGLLVQYNQTQKLY